MCNNRACDKASAQERVSPGSVKYMFKCTNSTATIIEYKYPGLFFS